MHDATEGGFIAALNELAGASEVGFVVDWERITVPQEALALKKHFGLSNDQLLAISSTGTILGAIKPQAKETVEATLQKLGSDAAFIGKFTQSKEKMIVRGGKETAFPAQADDPYTAIMTTS
jgi:hydrogenase maturation factor